MIQQVLLIQPQTLRLRKHLLENGCVSGFDTHENLVENNKVYREIYEVQTQGGGDFDEAGE